jgi:hypothetical protein
MSETELQAEIAIDTKGPVQNLIPSGLAASLPLVAKLFVDWIRVADLESVRVRMLMTQNNQTVGVAGLQADRGMEERYLRSKGQILDPIVRDIGFPGVGSDKAEAPSLEKATDTERNSRTDRL